MKIPEELLQLQRLIFFIQRPAPENILSFNVALMYNNAYIIDFLVEISKKDKIVNIYSERHRTLSISKMMSQKIDTSEQQSSYCSYDTIASKCIKKNLS